MLKKAESGEIEIKRPDYWGGFRIIPMVIEFWQGQRSRFHDRFLYERKEEGSDDWEISLLAP